MPRSKIAGIGHYIPEHVVTNNDLSKVMDTSDEWIQERTGIKERRLRLSPTEISDVMKEIKLSKNENEYTSNYAE